jgi:hypothetical protein
MQWFRDESWSDHLIDNMMQCAEFKKHWDEYSNQLTHIPARPLTPLLIKSPHDNVLQFRLISEPFVQDRRFRVIYCLPADPETIQQCLQWLEHIPQSK